jgi:hypothetical protein
MLITQSFYMDILNSIHAIPKTITELDLSEKYATHSEKYRILHH